MAFTVEQTKGIVREIIESVARLCGLTPDELTGRKRDREASKARRIAMYLIRQRTDLTWGETAQVLGGRDALSVVTGLRWVEKNMKDCAPIIRAVQRGK